MIVLPVFGQTGTYTENNLFYLPDYGAYGLTEYNEYNAYMEIADLQIWANKTAIAEVDLTLYYLKTAIDSQSKVETIWGVSLANDSELHTILTLGTANGLSLDGQALSLAVADTDTTGALNDTDWDIFNNKQAALTFGIADTNKVQIDDADAADNDFPKFTPTGLEGRSYLETRNDLNIYIVYPQEYATGTGTDIDPWVGWRAATYAACPIGGTISFRAGYYGLDASFTITKAMTIIGEGIGKTFVVTADAHGFWINDTDYVTIKNMTIDGNAQTDDVYRACIVIGQSDYALVENIEAKNAGQVGIDSNTTNYSIVQNIFAHDNFSHGVHAGTDVYGGNMYNTYRNIYAWDNGFNGFDDRGNGDYNNSDLNNTYDNIHCWDNTVFGISISEQASGTITNCSANGNTQEGIILLLLDDFNISDCHAENNGEYGIYLRYGEDVSFVNVIVKNNGMATYNTYAGIMLSDCNGTRLTNVQSYDDRTITGIDIAFVDGGAGADTITQVSAQFLKSGFVAGRDITVTGDSDNNGVYTIVSVVAGTITLATGELPAAPEAAGDSVTIACGMMQPRGLQTAATCDYVDLVNCKLMPNVNGAIYNGASAVISYVPKIAMQTATGDGTTTIDWSLGVKFQFTFGAQNETFTFSAPILPCNVQIELIQDGTGSRTITFPATVMWAGGVAPTLTTAASGVDVCSFWWNGTNYLGVASLAFATP